MAELEKYIPRRISTDVAPDALHPNGADRLFLPGDMVDALNCRYMTGKKRGVNKNTPGNIGIPTILLSPSGENKVIGCIPWEKEASLLYFVWNSLSQHRIIQFTPDEDDINSGIFEIVMSGVYLNFSKDHYITGGCIDDNVIFNDRGYNQARRFNIVSAKNGDYNAAAANLDWVIGLAVYPPNKPPTFQYITVLGATYNYLAGNVFQFVCRYVFKDGEQSVLSPVSKLAWKDVYVPDPTPLVIVNNAIRITVSVRPEILMRLKSLQFLARIGNEGDFFIFKEVTTFTLTNVVVDFLNNEKKIAIAKEDQTRLSESIPIRTETLEIIDSRVFLPLNKVGFDVADTFNLTLSLQNTVFSAPPNEGSPLITFKEDASHGVGIVFYEDFNRSSFVKKSSYITIPREAIVTNSSGATGIDLSKRKRIAWQITGTPPAGMKRYSIVLTKDSNNLVYMQCAAIPFKYVRELGSEPVLAAGVNIEQDNFIIGGSGDPVNSRLFNWRGKRFAPNGPTSTKMTSLYLQIPINSPVIPEVGDIVRVLTPAGLGVPRRTFTVKGVIGDFIDIGDFGFGPVNLVDHMPVFIELSKPVSVGENEVFYEIGEFYDIVNGAFSVTSGVIEGDTFLSNVYTQKQIEEATSTSPIKKSPFHSYDYMNPNDMKGSGINDTNNLPQGLDQVRDYAITVESPTNILKAIPSTLIATDGEGSITNPKGSFTTGQGIVFDYSRISAHYGRPHVVNIHEKEHNYYNVYGFSNPYIQNSNINGLNEFFAENQYTIPVERTPTKRLIRAGGVLLAIHERATSSLYIGEGFMRQNNDFILAKTEGVVGDDRQLQEGYGTINPESVIVINNSMVIWWDAYRGAVVRYTNAGLFPISYYGMANYFMDKSRQYYKYRNTAKIISGYDYESGEYLITFPDIKNEGNEVIIQGVTWAFSTRDNVWTTRYSFKPEHYADLGISLYSFLAGEIWIHNKNSIHNNFYGTQYQRSSKFYFNARLGKNKRLLNVHIRGTLCADPTSSFQVVKIITPDGQETYIPAHDFELDEGMWTAPVPKDINTPVEQNQLALRSGDDIMGNIIEIEVLNDDLTDAPVSQLNLVYKTEEFSI